MHSNAQGASTLRTRFLAIQALERAANTYWFLTLGLRLLPVGVVVAAGYLLPVPLAAVAERIGSGRCVAAALLLTALGFVAGGSNPDVAAGLITLGSALFRASFGPTLARSDDPGIFPLANVTINLAATLTGLWYGRGLVALGPRQLDYCMAMGLLLAFAVAIPLLPVRGVRSAAFVAPAAAALSETNYLRFAASLLGHLLVYVPLWGYQTTYRESQVELMRACGLPIGAVFGTLCATAMLTSMLLGMRRASRALEQVQLLQVTGSLLVCGSLLAARAIDSAQLVASHKCALVLAGAGVYGVGEALFASVAQRSLMSLAPSREVGSAAYFATIGLGAFLSTLFTGPLYPVQLAGFAVAGSVVFFCAGASER